MGLFLQSFWSNKTLKTSWPQTLKSRGYNIDEMNMLHVCIDSGTSTLLLGLYTLRGLEPIWVLILIFEHLRSCSLRLWMSLTEAPLAWSIIQPWSRATYLSRHRVSVNAKPASSIICAQKLSKQDRTPAGKRTVVATLQYFVLLEIHLINECVFYMLPHSFHTPSQMRY